MGYFSNGSDGAEYEAKYCDKCLHQKDGCMVWLAHMEYNYEECNKKDSILNMLIPRDDKGWNKQCTMFVTKSKGEVCDGSPLFPPQKGQV